MNFHVRHLVVDDVRVVHGHRLSVSSGFFSLVVLWFVSLFCSRLPMFAGTQSSTRYDTPHTTHTFCSPRRTHIRKSHPLFFLPHCCQWNHPESSWVRWKTHYKWTHIGIDKLDSISSSLTILTFDRIVGIEKKLLQSMCVGMEMKLRQYRLDFEFLEMFSLIVLWCCVFCNDREQCESSDNFARWS